MKTHFSELLGKFRKKAGFHTAYRFYNDNGGEAVLNFSYRKYLRFEQGEALPSPEVLRRISLALRLIPKSPPAGEFAAAWVRTLAGEETYDSVFKPFISVRTNVPGFSPMHGAIGKLLKKVPLTVDQSVLILSSREHYRSFLIMAHDAGAWTAETLAELTGGRPADAKLMLANFTKARLTRKLKNGAYTFRREGIILEFPRAEMLPRGLNDRMRDYQAEMVSSGTLEWRRMNVLRADAAELPAFYPVLSLSMSAATGYDMAEKTDNSALFAIESRVVKLFDF